MSDCVRQHVAVQSKTQVFFKRENVKYEKDHSVFILYKFRLLRPHFNQQFYVMLHALCECTQCNLAM